MLLRETHLTFKQIAHEWARELDDAKKPGRLNRDEIFLNMVNGVWRGQFANLTIEQALRDDKDGRSYKPAPMPITREVLDKVVLVRQGARQRDPGASRWEFLASLKLGEYDEPLFLRVYLEPLTISKEDFARWCDEQGHQRPRFWFGEQADARARIEQYDEENLPCRKTVGSKGGYVGRWPANQSQAEKIWEEFYKLAQAFTFKRGELTHIAGKIGGTTGYKQNSVEKLIRSKYRELEEKKRQNST